MPMYDFRCERCGNVFEELVPMDHETVKCSVCRGVSKRQLSVVSFRIKGARAANGYGLKSIDTYGVNKETGEESGCSYTPGKGRCIDHNQARPGRGEVTVEPYNPED